MTDADIERAYHAMKAIIPFEGMKSAIIRARELMGDSSAPQSQVDSGAAKALQMAVNALHYSHDLDEGTRKVRELLADARRDPQSQGEKAVASEDARDAERYRFIKSKTKTFSLDMGGNHTYVMDFSIARLRGPSLDAAIDAAVAAIAGEKK